jgi:two-component system response regulator EvgA
MPAFLVIEDHPLTRRALADDLRRLHPDATVEVAGDLDQGIDRAERMPEGALVILDLGLPRCAGLASLRRLLAAVPHARVVVFSGADDTYTMVEARRLGARAFVPKTCEAEHFAEAIGAVLGGRLAFPPETLRISTGRLNAAEIEVLRVIARGVGRSRGEVGEALGVTERVIKRRLNNIYEKLGVGSRVEALARARSLGISLGDG